MRAILVLLLLLSAGCLSGSNGGEQEDLEAVQDAVINAALPVLLFEHPNGNHTDAALHRASMNLDRLGYSNGVDNSGDADAIGDGVFYTELAIHGSYAYLARASVMPELTGVTPPDLPVVKGGFVVINIEDPYAPRFVGAYDAPNAYDIDISDDGQLAFLATQRSPVEQLILGTAESQAPDNEVPRGVHVVSLADKSNPTQVGFLPLPPNGPHTTTYYHDGVNEFLIVQTYDFFANTIPSSTVPGVVPWPGGTVPMTQRVLIEQITRAPTGDVVLAQVNQFQINDNAPANKLFFPHDSRVAMHPDGNTYLYVAYWDKGMQVVLFNDPLSVPLQAVGTYNDFSPSSRNNIHLVQPFDEPVAGMHVTVTEPEIISAGETGYYFFLDTTDMADIKRLGSWTLPGDLVVNNLDFSPHNFDTFDGKIVLAHNHGGLWIVDVGSAEDLAAPKAVAFTTDVVERANSPRNQPHFWGAFEINGLIYASDESSGLYILRYSG